MGKGGRGKNKSVCRNAAQQLPPGPTSLQQILDFPDVVWQRVFVGEAGSERLHRVKHLLRSGLDLSSQYSGKGTAETCASHLFSKLVEEEVFPQDGPQQWCMTTAFDLKQFAIDVMRSHKGGSRPKCIFGDMHCCLTSQARRELDRLTPAKNQSVTERLNAFVSMDEYLKEHAVTALPRDRKAPCFIHTSADGCPVWPQKRGPDTFTVWVAGQTCKDVSRRGTRQGFAGPHTRAYIVWVHMVRSQTPDMIIHEITCSADAEDRLKADLEDLYEIQTCSALSPHMLGVPVQRYRQYSIAVLRQKYVQVGSWAEFLQVFESTCELSGDVYFQANDAHRAEVSRAMAQRNGWYVADGETPTLEEQLSPAELRRMQEYQAKARNAAISPGDFYCFDVEQEVPFGALTFMGPCLISHGKIVHGTRQVVATGLEHLLVMGALAD